MIATKRMATALVVDLPKMGDEVFEVAANVAGDDDAWRTRDITVDGQTLTDTKENMKADGLLTA